MEILSCPVCGSNPTMFINCVNFGNGGNASIVKFCCSHCHVTATPFMTDKDFPLGSAESRALDSWNDMCIRLKRK